MLSTSPRRFFTARVLALVAAVAGAPMACTLDRAGLPPGSTSLAAGGGGAPSASSSSSTGGGTMAMTDCKPGDIQACYGGPPATKDKGVCKAGHHTCNAEGTGFDACVGEVVPAATDDCVASVDATCDGTLECACIAGEQKPCYTGPAGTQNVGVCKSGAQICKPDGTGYAACVGDVKPTFDSCFTVADEDCDMATPACTGATLSGAHPGGVLDDVIFAVAADPLGNILVGGVGDALPPSGASFDVTSGFGGVLKVDPSGKTIWSAQLTSTVFGAYSVVRGVASDAAGNTVIVGEFLGPMIASGQTLPSGGGVDIFVIKLDATGAQVWAKAFGDEQDQFGDAVAIDAAGNIFITGTMNGGADFGGGKKSAGGGGDLFVAKLDPAGNHVWSSVLGDDVGQGGLGVAATPAGDVVVVGEVHGTLDFGSGKSITSAGKADMFVAKLAGASGAALWAHRYGDANDQVANAVAVAADGDVVFGGAVEGKFAFGVAVFDAKGSLDAFVARLHEDGSPVWGLGVGDGPSAQSVRGVAFDPAGNVLLAGWFKGTIAFGATVLTDTAPPNSKATDMFVAKLQPNGTVGWARALGDESDQTAWAVATDPHGKVIVGGTFEGTVDFGSPVGMLTPAGGYDAFWVELAP